MTTREGGSGRLSGRRVLAGSELATRAVRSCAERRDLCCEGLVPPVICLLLRYGLSALCLNVALASVKSVSMSCNGVQLVANVVHQPPRSRQRLLPALASLRCGPNVGKPLLVTPGTKHRRRKEQASDEIATQSRRACHDQGRGACAQHDVPLRGQRGDEAVGHGGAIGEEEDGGDGRTLHLPPARQAAIYQGGSSERGARTTTEQRPSDAQAAPAQPRARVWAPCEGTRNSRAQALRASAQSSAGAARHNVWAAWHDAHHRAELCDAALPWRPRAAPQSER